jgi:outer membrane protein assembly factor BamB
MNRFSVSVLNLFLLTVPASAAEPISKFESFWPQWRGPQMNGVSPFGDPPIEWNENRNIDWKVAIPGKGSASPIVWEDKIFVLSAVPSGEKINVPPHSADTPQWRRGIQADQLQQFTIMALSRDSGNVVWSRVLREELPHEGTHSTGTWASASPSTDGKNVYAFFGSRGLYCLDMTGKVLWERDLGDMKIKASFGEGSSPFLFGEHLVVNWDHEGQSFVVVLSKDSGEEVWRVNRDEITSWATPVVVENEGVKQVIVSATHRVRGYDLENGSLIWECEGMTGNVIPSPIVWDGMVYVTSGFRGNALLAIRLAGAQNDITGTSQIVWSQDRHTPYVPSPLLYEGSLYFLSRNSNVISNVDARTGEPFYGPERLTDLGNIYSSPVGASGRIYVTDRDGTTVVLSHGRELDILAVNSLDDGFDASPAIVDNELYLRGQKYLYRISDD